MYLKCGRTFFLHFAESLLIMMVLRRKDTSLDMTVTAWRELVHQTVAESSKYLIWNLLLLYAVKWNVSEAEYELATSLLGELWDCDIVAERAAVLTELANGGKLIHSTLLVCRRKDLGIHQVVLRLGGAVMDNTGLFLVLLSVCQRDTLTLMHDAECWSLGGGLVSVKVL